MEDMGNQINQELEELRRGIEELEMRIVGDGGED
jgi:hypothetical protein